jgi:hypothetical protein
VLSVQIVIVTTVAVHSMMVCMGSSTRSIVSSQSSSMIYRVCSIRFDDMIIKKHAGVKSGDVVLRNDYSDAYIAGLQYSQCVPLLVHTHR